MGFSLCIFASSTPQHATATGAVATAVPGIPPELLLLPCLAAAGAAHRSFNACSICVRMCIKSSKVCTAETAQQHFWLAAAALAYSTARTVEDVIHLIRFVVIGCDETSGASVDCSLRLAAFFSRLANQSFLFEFEVGGQWLIVASGILDSGVAASGGGVGGPFCPLVHTLAPIACSLWFTTGRCGRDCGWPFFSTHLSGVACRRCMSYPLRGMDGARIADGWLSPLFPARLCVCGGRRHGRDVREMRRPLLPCSRGAASHGMACRWWLGLSRFVPKGWTPGLCRRDGLMLFVLVHALLIWLLIWLLVYMRGTEVEEVEEY